MKTFNFIKNKNLINIFWVYFFLTFAIGFADFDRRVFSFDKSTENLKSVVTGEATVPLVRRVLIPYAVYFFHRVSHMPLNYTYAAFRFILFFLSFIIFHIYLKKWFDDKLAMIGTLSLIASLPLILTNYYCIPTDMPELITFILGAMWIRDNKFKNLLILIPVAAFNRETTIALVLLYFLNGIGKEKIYVLIKRTAMCFFLWLIPTLFLVSIFGLRTTPMPYYILRRNCEGLLHIFTRPNIYNEYYFILYLCGFYWFLAFRDFHNKDAFLKRSVIVIAIYFLYAFFSAGALNEVRMFVPFYVFIIPLGLCSLFKERY